eukprot:1641864-Lingulodinium_polyedra.AAC.1
MTSHRAPVLPGFARAPCTVRARARLNKHDAVGLFARSLQAVWASARRINGCTTVASVSPDVFSCSNAARGSTRARARRAFPRPRAGSRWRARVAFGAVSRGACAMRA